MSSVHEVGEIALIERLRRRLGRSASVVVGIGDDAAVLRAPRSGWLLLASDMLVEGVHFDRRSVPAAWIGWKALACNVSDIAAMGGRPLWATVSLGVPARTPVRFIEALYAGLERCARRFAMALVGGDTVRAPQVVIDVAIVGTVAPAHLVRRSGVRVNDALFVTGRLGGSLSGGRHARFMPRLAAAQALVRRLPLHAMIDLSDGLASDLWQMSRASGTALRVEARRVPVSSAARACRCPGCFALIRRAKQSVWGRQAMPTGRQVLRASGPSGPGALHHALMDGEDFELLFAVAARQAHRVPGRIGSCPITRIGRAVARGVNVELEHPDGRVTRLIPQGFQHF